MYDNIQDVIDATRAAPLVLRRLVTGLSEAEIRERRGGDEQWNIIEIICHMRDVEERTLERMRLMRDRDNPWLAGYDQDQWARERSYTTADLEQALQDFERFRALYVDELKRLTPEQWEREGTHEEFGRITIFNRAIHVVAHDTLHAAQIAALLAATPRVTL